MVSKKVLTIKGLVALGLIASVSLSCGKSNSSDPAAVAVPTTAADPAPAAATTANALAQAFPGSLALTVFPTDSGTSLRLKGANLAEEEFDPNEHSLKDKVAEQEKIAAGTADSCLPSSLGKTFTQDSDETCYEFDQDMIYGTNDSSIASPKWLGTRNGKSAAGEACLVAFTRNQVSTVIAMVDETLGFGMAAICQHKKINAGVELPAIGATAVDLAPALTALFGAKVTVKSATLERLADANDLPVYRILIVVTRVSDGIERTIGIIHSPKSGNAEYSGTLYTVMKGVPSFKAAPAGGTSSQATKYQHMSITYNRTVTAGVKTITAELRSAQIASALAANAITSEGVLDLNVGTNAATGTLGSAGFGDYTGYAQANDAVDGITFVAFQQDEDTGEGSLAYWKNPGGNYYENARGFNIAIERNADTDVLEGCATSGAASINFSSGISVRRYLNDKEAANSLTLAPKGFWHPFMNSPTSSGTDSVGTYKSKTQMSNQVTKWYVPAVATADAGLATTFVSQSEGSLITRQCFTQDSTTGLYVIDTSKTAADAGFELLDTGNVANAAKFIALPPPAPPLEDVVAK